MKRIFTLFFTLCFGVCISFAQDILFADFETALDEEWTAENLWEQGDAGSLSSQFLPFPQHTNFMAVNDDAAGQGVSGNGKLISPTFSLLNVTEPYLSLDAWFVNGDYNGSNETAKVMLSTDGGTNWIELLDLGGSADWETHYISLMDYAGMDTVQVAFDYNDGNNWNFGYAVDNIRVFEPNEWDIAISSFDISQDRYNEEPVASTLNGTTEIINLGRNTIKSFDFHWSDGTTTYTETISGVNIGIFEKYSFSHESEEVAIALASVHIVDMLVDNLNGENTDQDETNNMGKDFVSIVSFVPERKVVVEEATGTWCPWCVRGIVGMEYMENNFPETFIGIAVHNGDPMVVAEYDASLAVGGYPSSLVNRAVEADPGIGELVPAYNAQLQVLSPVTMSELDAIYDQATRELTVTLTSQFAGPVVEGDFRFNLVITEDNVTGTGAGYNQENGYAGGSSGPMGGFENMPGTISASQMEYDHVARAILGGFAGTEGSIPTNVDFNETHTYTYNYTIPANFDEMNIHVIGMIIDNESGLIYNANSISIPEIIATDIDDLTFNENLARVFPNPFSDATNIHLVLPESSEVSVQAYNTVGQLVTEKMYGELMGEQMLSLDAANLPDGTYFLHIRVADQVVTKRVTKVK